MSKPTLTTLEMAAVDDVLGMHGGYVLDFSDRTFDMFFGDLDLIVDDTSNGGSKANRLRTFLRTQPASQAGRVLTELLKYRGTQDGDDTLAALPKYQAIISRLAGIKVPLTPADADANVLTLGYVQELEQKAEKRLSENDPDGAITVARTLLESVLAELELKITGGRGEYAGDLPKQYKAVAKLLRIDDKDDQVDESFKQIARGLTQIVNGVAAIRNAASDSHARQVQPKIRHARVAVNSAKTVASFLIEVYLAQHSASGSRGAAV